MNKQIPLLEIDNLKASIGSIEVLNNLNLNTNYIYMVGGLLNIISQGDENIILIGNAQKSFFQKTFVAHTNFGKQNLNFETD